MDIDKIIQWLYAYSENELQLKNYYEKHGYIMPQELEDEVFQPEDMLIRAHSNDLRNAASMEHLPLESALYNPSVYNEPMFFGAESDIFLHRHPRYTSVPMHKHQFYEIVYVYQGRCTQMLKCLNDAQCRHMEEGDFLFIPAGQEHSLTVDSDSIVINIGVRTSTFVDTFLCNIPENSILGSFFSMLLTTEGVNQFIIFHTNGRFSCTPYLHQLFVAYCTPGIYANNITNLQLCLLFLHLLQEYSSSAELINTGTNSVYRIPAIIAYMEEHFDTVNVKTIASHFGYSTDHLNRIFRQCTSRTISDMLLKIKMERAQQLLKNPDLTVSNISERLGYKDTTNFTRNFKKYYGTTPQAFRSSHTPYA